LDLLRPFRRSPAPTPAPATEQKGLSLTDPGALELFGVSPAGSGISVTAASAMRVPAVAQAVRLISETCGSLPAKLYSREDKSAATEHPAFRLVHDEANEWTSAAQLRTALTLDALTNDKGGFAQVVRLSNGTPFEMHRLDPSRVTPKTGSDGTPFYEITSDRGPVRLAYTDVLHVQAFGGVSPITLAREAIALAIVMEQHSAQTFANGARPSGIIRSEKTLDVEAKRKLASSWFNTHSGKRAGGTALLDEGMTYDALSLSMVDAQFQESRVEQVREIARAFGVPPSLLWELSRATWSNAEEMGRSFLTLCLRPWLEAWVWAYSRVLLTPEERAQLYVEFNVEALLSTSHAARATAYGQYRSMGAITGNEVRAGLNLPPHPEGDTLANPHITTPDNAPKAEPEPKPEGDAE